MDLIQQPTPFIMATSPLEVDIILDNIFQYFSGRELTHVRRVCRKWWDLSRHFLKDRIDQVSVNFGAKESSQDDDEDDDDERHTHGQDVLTFNRYGYSFLHPTVLSFTNFSFTNMSLNHFFVQDFFNKYGTMIKVLKIEYNPDRGGDNNILDSATLRALVLEQCPNLVEMKLINIPQGWERNSLFTKQELESPSPPSCKIEKLTISYTPSCTTGRIVAPYFIWGMAQICPKLNDVTILISGDEGSKFSPYAKTFFCNLQDPQNKETFKVNLTNLKFSHLSSEILNLLPNSLKLSKFEAEFISLDLNNITYKFLPFLAAQSLTLEILSMPNFALYVPKSTPPPQIFPNCMEKVTCLTLGLSKCAQIDFALQFPSLQTLIILHNGDVVHPMNLYSLISSSPLKSLTTLELPACLTRYHFDMLGSLLQNVKHLCLGYQCSFWLDKIGENCSNLISLYVCGYPPPELANHSASNGLSMEKILEGFDEEKVTLSQEIYNETTTPTFTSFSNLTNIRELTIHGSATKEGDLIPSYDSIDVMNDDMLRQVVGKMKDLKYLHITVENNANIRYQILGRVLSAFGTKKFPA